MPCPHCHQNAPILYKGVFAFCSACDKPRAPFSGKALAFAGQPAKVGGRVGRVVGALVLIFGLLLAAALMLFFQFLWPAENIGYALGSPIALISIVTGTLFMIASGRLGRAGVEAERQARVEAVYALAVNRNGMLTAADAARSLQLDPDSVAALLNELAKTQPEYVSLELDENGQSFYLFSHGSTRPHPFGAKYRVGAEGRVRVADVLGVDGPRETLDEQGAQRRNGN
ncbi:MAG TPA: hypothetical protein VJV79_26100 [Polyangiaceae bacterium]|nr:hypothetical protein [Polyangiaceae bacterium]